MSIVSNLRPSAFLATIQKHKGPARVNRYKIILPAFSGFNQEELNHLCRSCDIPDKTISVIESKIGATTYESPSGIQFGDFTLTFNEVQTGIVEDYFNVWMDLIMDPVSGLSSYRKDFASDISVFRLSNSGVPVAQFKMLDCWPKTRPAIAFNDESQDEVQKITVNLSCRRVVYNARPGTDFTISNDYV